MYVQNITEVLKQAKNENQRILYGHQMDPYNGHQSTHWH